MLQIFGTGSSCLGSRQEDGAPGESAWKRTGSIFKPPLSWLLIVCLFNTGGGGLNTSRQVRVHDLHCLFPF